MTQTPLRIPSAPRKPKRSSIVHVKDVPAPQQDMTPSTSRTDEMSDVSCDLLFLHPPVFLTDRELLHREVFKKCEEAGLDPKWVDEQAIKRVQTNDLNFFILHQFEGSSYEILKTRKCKTISSFLVRECLREETPLPKINVPIYSKHLQGARVTFTGFTNEEKERLTSLVFAMGGHVSPRFSERITHIVANGYICENSGKYKAARELKVPVMDVSWLENSWLKAQAHEPFNCTSSDFVREHQMPLFKGLVITKTGVSQAQMPDLIRAIEINGGKYSSSLTQQCTHMITEACAGDKYRKVKEWERRGEPGKSGKRVYLVNLKWLMKSIETGYIQSESRYDPERPTCSTPTHEAPVQDLELSAIAGQQNGKLDTQINFTFHPNFTSPMDDRIRRFSSVSNTPVLATVFKTPTSTKGLTSEKDRVSILRRQESKNSPVGGDGGVRLSLPRSNSVNLLCQDPVAMLNRKLRELNDPIESLNANDETLNQELDILEGTRMLIIGATNSTLSIWKRVLNCLGACRVTKIMSDTLVVVVRIFGSEDEKKVREAQEAGVMMVKAEWVHQCLLQKDQISTNDYLWSDFVAESERQVALELEGPRRDNAEHQDLELATKSGLTTELHTQSNHFNQESNLRSQNRVTNDDEIIDNDQFPSTNFLSGKTVRIFEKGMDDEDVEALKKEIHTFGGAYTIPTGKIADYLICPLIEFGTVPSPTDENVEHIVTGFWLRCCILAGSLLEPNASPLYRPIPACAGSTIFNGLIVSATGLEHPLREEILDLVQQFGGTFQPSISRVDKGNNRKNTHVIAGRTSEKTKTATQWGVQVIDPAWVIESVINDRILTETMFPVGEAPFSTYSGRSDDVWQMCEMGRFDVEYVMKSTLNSLPQNECSTMRSLPPQTSCHDAVNDQPASQFGIQTNNQGRFVAEEPPQPSCSSSKFDSQILFKPRFRLEGVDQIIDDLETQHIEGASIGDTATVRTVGRILEKAVEKTGASKPPSLAKQAQDFQQRPEILPPPPSKPPQRLKRDYALTNKMHEELTKEEVISTTDGLTSRISTQIINQTNTMVKRRRIRDPSQNEGTTTTGPTVVADSIEVEKEEQALGGPSSKRSRKEVFGWGEEGLDEREQQMKRFDESLAQKTPTGEMMRKMSIRRAEAPPQRTAGLTESTIKDDNDFTATNVGITRQKSTGASHLRNSNVPSTSAVKPLQAQPIGDEAIKEEPISLPETSKARKGADWNFSFSSILSATQLHELEDIVLTLGARSLLAPHNEQQPWLSNKTTHLITGRLIRNEKCLSAIAIGAYLLVPQYLEDSKRQEHFLEVEPYEWNSRTDDLQGMKQREKSLAESAVWWRQHLAEKRASGTKNAGAFTGWRAIIYAKPSKSEAVIRIIKCGGGEAVCRSTLSSTMTEFEPTHALVENCQFWSEEELMLLIKCRARAFPLDYTATYLARHGRYDLTDTLEDYRKCIGTMPRNRHN